MFTLAMPQSDPAAATNCSARRICSVKIALDRPCSTSFKVGANHYLVSRSYVTLTKTPASTNLVTYCQRS